jgi:hypothetical protein
MEMPPPRNDENKRGEKLDSQAGESHNEKTIAAKMKGQ